MGRRKPRPRRFFSGELKAEIVKLCQRGDRSVGQIAKDFDLTETAVRQWVTQAELDAGTRTDGLTTDERPSWSGCGGRTAGCLRTWRFSSGRRLLREGDPVNVYPFIEAEIAGRGNVKRACELLNVDTTDDSGARRASSDKQHAAQPHGDGVVAGMNPTQNRRSRHRQVGRWVLLDARFLRVLNIGAAPYHGIAPKTALDPIAKRILLPRMRAASRDGGLVAAVAEDRGRRWNVRVEPLVGPHSGELLALRGCYWPSDHAMPAAPPVGCWELRLTPDRHLTERPRPDEQHRSIRTTS